jgi:hypothetical protein
MPLLDELAGFLVNFMSQFPVHAKGFGSLDENWGWHEF